MARVLIFGATSAIASEVAAIHAARGDELHIIGRSAGKLRALERRLQLPTSQLRTTLADFDDTGAAEALVSRVVAELGGVDAALLSRVADHEVLLTVEQAACLGVDQPVCVGCHGIHGEGLIVLRPEGAPPHPQGAQTGDQLMRCGFAD